MAFDPPNLDRAHPLTLALSSMVTAFADCSSAAANNSSAYALFLDARGKFGKVHA